jgi:uncharacterized membrane-anchored protein
MKNKLLYSLLYVPALVLSGVMIYYTTESNFSKVEIAVQGYDPKDFFSGYYMNLQPDWEKTDCGQFEKNVCPVREFRPVYNYYIRREQSARLSQKVNAGDVKLVFSYAKGHMPMVVDLKVNGVSYLDYVGSNM